jgi:hypothetical protein
VVFSLSTCLATAAYQHVETDESKAGRFEDPDINSKPILDFADKTKGC